MKLVKPNLLKKGDTIGIISPSAGLAPFAMHRIENAVTFFKKSGFDVLISKHALENDGYVSASIEARLEDIHSMFSNPNIKAIVCTIGGNNSNQLLPYIDYKLIKNNPKIFVGYSDISVLHFALQSQAGLATYYGPCIMTQFGEYPKPLEYSIKYFLEQTLQKEKNVIKFEPADEWTEETLDWFKKKDLERQRRLLKNSGYKWLKKGKAKGRAWGGTIPSITYLLGTKYWVDPNKSIFFLDIPEGKDFMSGLPLSEVDAYLTNLDNAGVFKSIKGLIVGRPYKYADSEQETLKKLIERVVKPYNFPVLYNANIGHTDPIVTICYGQEIELDSYNNLFRAFR